MRCEKCRSIPRIVLKETKKLRVIKCKICGHEWSEQVEKN